MTSQPGGQTIAIHILANISQSKGNQEIKFGQLIEYNQKNIFLQKSSRQEAQKLVPDIFLFLRKTLYKIKLVVCSLVSLYIEST